VSGGHEIPAPAEFSAKKKKQQQPAKHKKSLKGMWRKIETTAGNILIAYNTLIARRALQKCA
jgi:hypothetical protein